MRRLPEPVAAQVIPPDPLPLHNVAPMVVFGLIFQGLASGPWAFTAAAWLCLLPLLVLVRALPWHTGILAAFAVPFLGRAAALATPLRDVDGGGLAAAAGIACATALVLLTHKLVMRELPLVGALAAPCAVVVIEHLAGTFALPGAAFLPLSLHQSGDVVFYRFIDVLTPLGISFGVAWGQSTMAGFGEAWLAKDPYPQAVRERGLRVAANLCFWILVVLFHVGGFFKAEPVSTPTHHDVVFAICATALIAMIIASVGTMLRRKPT